MHQSPPPVSDLHACERALFRYYRWFPNGLQVSPNMINVLNIQNGSITDAGQEGFPIFLYTMWCV